MDIGLFVPLASPMADAAFLHGLGTMAEERGFHSLWVAEHVVLVDEYESQYPYSEDGQFPAGGEVGILEPMTALSFLAAVTNTIRLGSGVCLVPQRNPVYTAKEATAVDWLSGGRLDFGVGIGWLAEEFACVQAPFRRRGARCRSYMEVIRRLWCDAVSEYQDEFYTLPACRQYPKPVQTPHPPIHFGGESDAALRRVADLAQGWYGYGVDPDATGSCLHRLRTMLEERGRSADSVYVSICPYLLDSTLEAAKQYRDQGVNQLIVFAPAYDVDGLRTVLDDLAEALVQPAGAL